MVGIGVSISGSGSGFVFLCSCSSCSLGCVERFSCEVSRSVMVFSCSESLRRICMSGPEQSPRVPCLGQFVLSPCCHPVRLIGLVLALAYLLCVCPCCFWCLVLSFWLLMAIVSGVLVGDKRG